jgi:hypothetical protein
MAFVVLIAIIVVLLSGAGLGVLALIIIDIHKVDRSKCLNDPPGTHAEAAVRRLLGVGTRTPSDGKRERG